MCVCVGGGGGGGMLKSVESVDEDKAISLGW